MSEFYSVEDGSGMTELEKKELEEERERRDDGILERINAQIMKELEEEERNG